jgi:hypothetical protein
MILDLYHKDNLLKQGVAAILEIMVAIMMLYSIKRSTCLIVENEDEVRIDIIKYMMLSTIAITSYLYFNCYEWHQILIIITCLALALGFISIYYLYVGDEERDDNHLMK